MALRLAWCWGPLVVLATVSLSHASFWGPPRGVRDLSKSDIRALRDFGVDLEHFDHALRRSADSSHYNMHMFAKLGSPDAFLTTPEIIRRQGYPAEVHHVKTEDGYILELHRIPPKDPSTKRVPVFLQHGILCSSSDWIIIGPEKGLAYLLHNKGLDVWMGNFRGNRYSRAHETYDPDRNRAKYWDFTFHESGVYDLPASIDYVLNQTGHSQLQYVAHSMGTTAFWVMCSQRPEYNDKVVSMSAMAPVAYMGHVRSPLLRAGVLLSPVLLNAMGLLGIREFLPNTLLLTLTGQIACKETAIMQPLCYNIVFLLTGYDLEQLNKTRLPVFLAHSPAGTSVKVLAHYTQAIKNPQFRMFSYGYLGNLRRYGSLSPPKYDISKVRVPVSLHYSDNDYVSGTQDVEKLGRMLPNAKMYHVSYPKFNHMDFMWAIDVKSMVYDDLIAFLDHHADVIT